MRLIVCVLLCLMAQVHPGQALDVPPLKLANRDKVKPIQTKAFLDALAAEYQRLASDPDDLPNALSTKLSGNLVQRAAFVVLFSKAERQNNPQNAGYLTPKFIVERYVQDILRQPVSSDPKVQAQQSKDASDYLMSVMLETDQIKEYDARLSDPSPRNVIDAAAKLLAGCELTVQSQASSTTGAPTFAKIETTRQLTQAMDNLIERYDSEVAKTQKLPGYKSEKAMGLSLFEQTSKAVNALPAADKSNAQRTNGLYDIANIPAKAMPLSEADQRRADEQEEEAEP